MSITTVYKVKLRESALRDLAELRDCLKTVMSREGAHRYVSNMRDEVMSLSVYADLYRPSHPFEDGNGRIARLMVNYIMARHGWPMIVIRNRKKVECLEALHRADQKIGKVPSDGVHATIGKIASFLAFFRQTVCKEMQCEIDIVRNADKETWWYDGQRIHFRSGNGSRLLALLRDKPFVTFSEMADYLSVNRSAVQKQIEGFRKKGYLDRRDDGSWHVLALNSNIKKA